MANCFVPAAVLEEAPQFTFSTVSETEYSPRNELTINGRNYFADDQRTQMVPMVERDPL